MRVNRFKENPILHEQTKGLGLESDNINGPSLIKVPSWVKNPLGKYYLYFAHHKGQHIKMAYANSLCGPWNVFRGGVLSLEQTPCTTHIASPDVHIDDENKKILMYYHGKHKTQAYPDNLQLTFLATSEEGLLFKNITGPLGTFYFRVFQHDNLYFAFSKSAHNCAHFLQAKSLYGPFEEITEVLPRSRHTAILQKNNCIFVFFSRIGDKPESIYCARFNPLTKNFFDEKLVLKPQEDYEGANIPLDFSKPGLSLKPVCELRDPYVFTEDDKVYLLYTNAGEKGICVAEITGL